jgi:hypothetical protein
MPITVRDYAHGFLVLLWAVSMVVGMVLFWSATTLVGYVVAFAAFVLCGLAYWGAHTLKPRRTLEDIVVFGKVYGRSGDKNGGTGT